MTEQHQGSSFPNSRRQKRLLRQATKPLETAECLWKDLVASLQPSEAERDPRLFEHDICTLVSDGADGACGPKATQTGQP